MSLPAIMNWIETALEITAVKHEPSNATQPRPAKPYASVQIISDSPLSSVPHEVTTDEVGVDPQRVIQRRSWLRQGVARVRMFGSDAVTAESLQRRLQLSVRERVIRNLLRSAGVTVKWFGDLSEIATLRDTSWGDQVQADYQVRYVDTGESDVDWIESATAVFVGV